MTSAGASSSTHAVLVLVGFASEDLTKVAVQQAGRAARSQLGEALEQAAFSVAVHQPSAPVQ